MTWLNQSCVFTNTLVDRIITGFPKDEADDLTSQLGYRDALIVAGEVFHCWVIESPRPLEEELPLVQAGLDVVWTTDMSPYRERKVRILNGAHTLVALAAFSGGQRYGAGVHGRSAIPALRRERSRERNPAHVDLARRRAVELCRLGARALW